MSTKKVALQKLLASIFLVEGYMVSSTSVLKIWETLGVRLPKINRPTVGSKQE